MSTPHEMAAGIVQAGVAAGTIKAEEIADKLKELIAVLDPEAAPEAVVVDPLEEMRKDPMTAIAKDQITCLECGMTFRSLSAMHLKSHKLTYKTYRKKYGYKTTQALCCSSMSATRRRAAKKRGVPAALVAHIKAKAEAKAAATAKAVKPVVAKPTAEKKVAAPAAA